MQFECKKPSVLVSKGKTPSSSVDVSIRYTPGPSDPVPIAGDRGGVPGSSDPVSTAARRGNGSYCGGPGCEIMISILNPSTSTFISSVNSAGYAGASELPYYDRSTDLERGWCWCESAFHPFRRPSQYGRNRTFASRSYAPRASANIAFALASASRQAP